MSTPLELVEHQLAAYNDRNLERFLEVFSDDIEVTRLPGTVPAIVGKAALAKFYRENRFSLPALHAEIQQFLMRQSSAREEPSLLASLTERERDLMHCLAQGHSNRQIAAELGLTYGTVKVYISTLLDKLGVADRTQAALLAARLDQRTQ